MRTMPYMARAELTKAIRRRCPPATAGSCKTLLALRRLWGLVPSEALGLDEFLVRKPATAAARGERRHRTTS
jgi:hypothetical protein